MLRICNKSLDNDQNVICRNYNVAFRSKRELLILLAPIHEKTGSFDLSATTWMRGLAIWRRDRVRLRLCWTFGQCLRTAWAATNIRRGYPLRHDRFRLCCVLDGKALI
jgi:hypothetical protein